MIISDSTILITLININEFNILKKYSSSIIITQEVYSEVSIKPYAKNYLDKEIKEGFVRVEKFKNIKLFNQIRTILDMDEASSITLALETDLPLIIDEKKGRKFAMLKGIKIFGLIGILRFLYVSDKVSKDKIIDIIEKLNRSNFRITKRLMNLILNEG